MSIPRPSGIRAMTTGTVVPKEPDPPVVKPVCFTCGSTFFSTISSIRVRKYAYNCPPGGGLQSITTEEWPYEEHDDDLWLWQKDTLNRCFRNCNTNEWSVVVEAVGYQGPCPDVIGPTTILSTTTGWELYMQLGGGATLLIATGTLINNSCVPSVPI